MSLTVLDPGACSLLVDAGRPASRSLGLPVGGAADPVAWSLGNAIVGNPTDAVALELALAGPTLRAETEQGIAVIGAPFEITAGGEPRAANSTFTLSPGEVLRIRGCRAGMRGYVCVPGGFDAPEIMGSRSSLEPIKPEQALICRSSVIPSRHLPMEAPFLIDEPGPKTLRALRGGHSDWFEPGALTDRPFQVSPDSNRMGLRLKGLPLVRPNREIISEPVCPGTIQVANDGQCIILGVDGQTIGGYPKIAHVISADLWRLGQLRPGDQVSFQLVDLSDAEAIMRSQRDHLNRRLAWIAAALS